MLLRSTAANKPAAPSLSQALQRSLLKGAAPTAIMLLTGAAMTWPLVCLLGCLQATHAGSTRSKKVTGVLCAVSSSPTGQTSSQLLQVVVHAPIVVSSCGALHTPALLLRSGITVGCNVGANLRLHPATGVTAVFDKSPQQAAAGRGAVEMHKGVSMGVFSRAAAHWEAGGYGAFLSVPAVQPGLLAAIVPDWRLGLLKETMLDLQDASLVGTGSSSRVRVGVSV